VDTRGTDFWLTFGENSIVTINEVDLQIRIVASSQDATGTIYFTALSTSVPFSVSAGGVFTHSLTNAEKIAVYNTTAGISNRSAHITSSTPVMVYALN